VDLACSLTGARAALLIDETSGELRMSNLDDRAEATRVAELLARTSSGERDEHQSIIDTTTRDGILRVGRIAVVVGRATPFFGTEERRLLEVLDGIERLVEERASVLTREREAMHKLRDIDELKTEFVAMVAHDLRSPMAVIAGFADTIAQRWDEFDDERKLEFLGLISRNAHSLAAFVEDVLHVARIDSGALAYDLSPFDARSVVTRVLDEVRLVHPDLELKLEIPEDVPRALGDAERHWQILSNLVGNAIKYTKAEHPRVTVQVDMMPDGRELAIAISDNGIGIAPADQERLFRRFSRVGADRAQFEGTGLGLYIVKSMVEAQGGRIWVASELGAGSTFTYTVPVAESA
jgi:two-component system sensor histidine kinase/response regulator